jgi:hypothetical protein
MSLPLLLVPKALVREDEVRGVAVRVELQRDLGLVDIGTRRFAGPREAQDIRRRDAATADRLAVLDPPSAENLFHAAEGYALCAATLKDGTP